MEKRRYGQTPTFEARAEANESVNKQVRYKQIIECLNEQGKDPFGRPMGMTAKEIAVQMLKKRYIPTSERNFVSPRLTELGKKGVVEPIGKTTCAYTGKTVSVWALREV